jgi:hypothetical protein
MTRITWNERGDAQGQISWLDVGTGQLQRVASSQDEFRCGP